jgi:hypothetical protein
MPIKDKDFSVPEPGETQYLLYNKSIDLRFKQYGHRYTANGTECVGVTTILNTVIAKGALLNWAVKMSADYMSKNLKADTKYTKEELEDIIKQAKKAHVKRKTEAGNIGTMVHKWIEDYINAKLAGIGRPRMPKNNNEAILAFLEWEKGHDIDWVESEKVVYSKKFNYAGTADFLAVIDGKMTLGDIKTSNYIYPESYFLQVCAYQYAIQEENPKMKIEDRLIVKVPKTKGKELEVVSIPEYEDNARAFIHGVYLYNQVMKLKFKG